MLPVVSLYSYIFLWKRYEFHSKQPYGGVALIATTTQPADDVKAQASPSFKKSAGLSLLFSFIFYFYFIY